MKQVAWQQCVVATRLLFVCLLGLDWGGLSREFFELMSVELFDVSNRLFMRFNEDDHQGLVRRGGEGGACRLRMDEREGLAGGGWMRGRDSQVEDR